MRTSLVQTGRNLGWFFRVTHVSHKTEIFLGDKHVSTENAPAGLIRLLDNAPSMRSSQRSSMVRAKRQLHLQAEIPPPSRGCRSYRARRSSRSLRASRRVRRCLLGAAPRQTKCPPPVSPVSTPAYHVFQVGPIPALAARTQPIHDESRLCTRLRVSLTPALAKISGDASTLSLSVQIT